MCACLCVYARACVCMCVCAHACVGARSHSRVCAMCVPMHFDPSLSYFPDGVLRLFAITQRSGTLVTRSSLRGLSGAYFMYVVAKDAGVPPKQSSIPITIKVQGAEDDDGTPQWQEPINNYVVRVLEVGFFCLFVLAAVVAVVVAALQLLLLLQGLVCVCACVYTPKGGRRFRCLPHIWNFRGCQFDPTFLFYTYLLPFPVTLSVLPFFSAFGPILLTGFSLNLHYPKGRVFCVGLVLFFGVVRR